MSPFVIAPATSTDVPALARLCAAIFAEDPLWRRTISGADREGLLVPLYERLLRFAIVRGRTLVAGTPVVGVVTWEPPMDPADAARLAEEARVDRLDEILGTHGLSVFLGAAARATAALARIAPADVQVTSCGVRPDVQRTGVGSRLFRAALDEIDAARHSASFYTFRSELVPWFATLGFSVRGVDVIAPSLECTILHRPGQQLG